MKSPSLRPWLLAGILVILMWGAFLHPVEAAKKNRKQVQQFRVSPLRVWGNTGFSYERSMTQGKKPIAYMGTMTSVSMDKSMSGYLWKPWMFRWSSTLGSGFNSSKNNTDLREDNTTATNPSVFSRNNSGSISAQIFPVSRFPVNLVYSYAIDDNSEGEGGGTARRSTSMAFSQSFRSPPGSVWNGSINYERKVNVSGFRAQSGIGLLADLKREEGRTIQDNYRSQFSLHQDDHNLGYSGTYDRSEVKSSAERYTLRNTNLQVNHDWNQSDYLSLNNLGNLGINRVNTEPSGVSSKGGDDTNARSMWRQYSNTISWRAEKEPLSVVASSRVYRSDLNVSDLSTGMKNWNGSQNSTSTISTNFQISNAMRTGFVVTGNYDIVHTPESYNANKTGSQSLTWNYSPLQVEMNEYMYRWNVNSSATNSVGDNMKPQVGSNHSLGHSLNRTFKLTDSTSLGYSVSETSNTSNTHGGKPAYGLSHTMSNLLSNNEATSNSMAVLSLSETRNVGLSHVRNYTSSLQLSRTYTMSETESLSANVTMQWGWVRSEQAETSETSSSNMDINYQNREFFSNPQLRFTTRLGVNSEGLVPLIKNGETEGYNFNSRLEYQIGLLTVGMTCEMQETITRRVGPTAVSQNGAPAAGSVADQMITAGRSALYMLEVRRYFNQVF